MTVTNTDGHSNEGHNDNDDHKVDKDGHSSDMRRERKL